jgi:NTP pyrophosphatase (non-canonical NTP hydrolase)
MELNDFQREALKSVAFQKHDPTALAHRSLGLTGEAGIIANEVKKIIRDKGGKPDASDLTELSKRLGDVMYYVAVLAEYFDFDLETILKQNREQSADFKEQRAS